MAALSVAFLTMEGFGKMTERESNAAKLLGRKGGRSKSEAKVQASRDNGKHGGRPKKGKDS